MLRRKLLYSKVYSSFFVGKAVGALRLVGSGPAPPNEGRHWRRSVEHPQTDLSRLSKHEGGAGCSSPRGPLEGCLVRAQRRETQHVFGPVCCVSYQNYSENELSRSGDEMRGGRERALAAAATAAGVAAGLEPHTVATMGTCVFTSTLSGCISISFSGVRKVTIGFKRATLNNNFCRNN